MSADLEQKSRAQEMHPLTEVEDPEMPDDVKLEQPAAGDLSLVPPPATAPKPAQDAPSSGQGSAGANPRKPCPARALAYYLQPVREAPRTLLRLGYHLVNFAWVFVMCYLVMACLAASLASIAAACVGLVLLYGTLEMAVGLAWLDLGMTYHMVEDDVEQRAQGRPRLGFRRGRLPDFCSDFRNRAKSLVTDLQLYSILFYQLIAKPVVTGLTSWVFVLVASDVATMFTWVWWLVDDRYLQEYACIGSETCEPELDVCDCQGWKLDTAGDVILLSLLALLVLPVVLRVSNFLAWCCLCTCYFFLTRKYDDERSDEEALLRDPEAPAPAGAGVPTAGGPVVAVAPAEHLQHVKA